MVKRHLLLIAAGIMAGFAGYAWFHLSQAAHAEPRTSTGILSLMDVPSRAVGIRLALEEAHIDFTEKHAGLTIEFLVHSGDLARAHAIIDNDGSAPRGPSASPDDPAPGDAANRPTPFFVGPVPFASDASISPALPPSPPRPHYPPMSIQITEDQARVLYATVETVGRDGKPVVESSAESIALAKRLFADVVFFQRRKADIISACRIPLTSPVVQFSSRTMLLNFARPGSNVKIELSFAGEICMGYRTSSVE